MRYSAKTKHTIAALMMSAVALSACASGPDEDPIEGFNRGVFAFNEVVDTYALAPVARGYRYITPQPVRDRVGNVADNLREPVNMINAFLQGDVQQGLTSFWRFALNSTVGIGGLNDVATVAGLAPRNEDFGQTLASYGVDSGPYIVLPIFGPSNGRDALGRVADFFTDPFHYYLDGSDEIWLAGGQGLVARERLLDPVDDVYETSLDPYVTFRSAYDQYRKAQIENRNSSFLADSDAVK